MRVINSIVNSLWILPLCMHSAVNSSPTKISPYDDDDSEIRVIFTNLSSRREPIAINRPSYHDFICNSEFFIDNSKLIPLVAQYGNLAVVLPRRFGKSTNLLMLECFYEIPIKCEDTVCKPIPKEQTEAYQIFQNGLLTTCNSPNVVKLKSDFQIKSTKHMAWMNSQPVLYLNFQTMGDKQAPNDLNEIYQYIITKIKMAYGSYYYLRYVFPAYDIFYSKLTNAPQDENSQRLLIMNAALELITMMYNYFGKPVILLIDEYDSILNTLYLSEKPATKYVQDHITHLFGQLYWDVLKGNSKIRNVFLTGIIPWQNSGMLAALSYAKTITVNQDRQMKYYGISDMDLQVLYDHFTINCQHLKETKEDLMEYYDGYLFGNNMKRYNPISIAGYFQVPDSLKRPRLQAYWSETGDATGTLAQLMKYSNFAAWFLNLLLPGGTYEIQYPDVTLLSQNSVQSISNSIQHASSLPPSEWYIANNKDIDNLFLYLYATGYLTKHKQSNYTNLILQIPNREIREVLWQNYIEIQTRRKQSKEKNERFQNALLQFVPILAEIVKTDETNCTLLANYFNTALHQLPPFTETEFGGEKPYYNASAPLVESILSGVLKWNYNQLNTEQRHSIWKWVQSHDKRKSGGRPDITVVFKNTKMTVFKIEPGHSLDEAYKQAMRYAHLYFLRSEYNDVAQIKVVPFVVHLNKSVYSNATICTREDFKKVEIVNPTIKKDLTNILGKANIPSECRTTCTKMLDWTDWNCAAEQSLFDTWKNAVIKDCKAFLTDEMTYFQAK